MVRILLVLLLATTISVNGNDIQDVKDLRNRADSIVPGFTGEWMHDLPRTSFTNYPDEVSNDIFQADTGDYRESLIIVGLAPLVIGLVVLLIGSICCCMRWGGVDCCTGFEGSKAATLAPVITFIVLSVMIVIMMVPLGIGFFSWRDGKDAALDIVIAKSTEEKDRGIKIAEKLEQLSDEAKVFTRGDDRTLIWQANEIENAAKYASDTEARYFDLPMLIILCLSVVVSLLTIVLGIFGAVCRVGPLAMMSACCGWVSSFLMWWLLAFFWVYAIMSSDLCYSIDDFTTTISTVNATDTPPRLTNGVPVAFRCIPDNHAGIYLNNSEIIKKANNSYTPEELVLFESVNEDLRSMRSCVWLYDALFTVEKEVCEDVLDGSILVWTAALVISILFIVYSIPMAIIWKHINGDQGDSLT